MESCAADLCISAKCSGTVTVHYVPGALPLESSAEIKIDSPRENG